MNQAMKIDFWVRILGRHRRMGKWLPETLNHGACRVYKRLD